MATTLATLSEEKASVRWKEPYVSDGLNRKNFGIIPCGVVRGGDLSVSASALTVEISPNSNTGDSLYAACTSDGRHLTVREEGTVSLSLNIGGVPGTVVYIGLKVDYTAGSDTVSTWGAYSEAEINSDETIVVIGKVDVPGSGVIPASDITPDRRRAAWLDRSLELRDGIQIAKSGSVDVPTPLAGILPFWNVATTGTLSIAHVDTDSRSKTHSFEVSGNDGTIVLSPHSGDLSSNVMFPVSEGQHIRFSFYTKANAVPVVFGILFIVNYYSEPTSGAPSSVGSRSTQVITGTDPDWVRTEGELVSPIDGWFDYSLYMIMASGNTGAVYLDDIKVWMGAEDPEEDDGQSRLMGINRQLECSALGILPASPPDSLETWADEMVRLVNISDPAGGSPTLRMTLDPSASLGSASPFVFWMEAEFRGLKSVYDSYHAIEGESNDESYAGVHGIGGMYGVFGEKNGGGTAQAAIGVYGYGYNPGTSQAAIGVRGYGSGAAGTQPGIGVLGLCYGNTSVGVMGVGDTSVPFYPSNDYYIGGYFLGKDAVDHATGIGIYRSGVIAFGGDGSSVGGFGGVFWGGNGDPFTRSGVYSHGGDASGLWTGVDGGHGGEFYGGSRSDGTASHGFGVYGEGDLSGGSSIGGAFLGAEDGFGAQCANDDANESRNALKLNSGIDFRRGNSDTESQNPNSDRALKNVLKAILVPKCWALVNLTAGSPTLLDGANVDSVSYANSNYGMRITFAEGFSAGDDYAVVATTQHSPGISHFDTFIYDTEAGYTSIGLWDTDVDTAVTLPGEDNYTMHIVIMGRMPLDDF